MKLLALLLSLLTAGLQANPNQVFMTNPASPIPAGSNIIGNVGVSHTVSIQGTYAGSVDGDVPETNQLPVEGYGMVFNGTTWDRQRGTAANGTATDLKVGGASTSASNPLSVSLPAYTNGNPLPVQIAASIFTLSTVNSSSAQLAAAATFTGGIEAAFNQPAAQVMVVCDQPYTVNVDQFDGANNLVDTDTFTRLAGVPLSETIQNNGDAVRVRVTNNGGSTTTTLRIETTFGPLAPFPSANSSLGNFKTTLNEVNGTVAASGAGATTAGTLRIVESSDSAVMLSGPASVGPVSVGATTAYLTVTAAGFPSVSFDVITGFTGTIVIEASADGGTTWTGIPFWYGTASAVPTLVTSQVNPATGSNIYVCTGGDSQIRMRPSVYTSGTGSIRGQASQAQVPITNAQTVASTTVTSISAGTNVLGSVTVGFPISGQALSVSSPAFASGIIVTNFLKASAAILSNVIVTNTSITTTSSVCVKIYNSASAPAVGAAGPVFRCTQVGPGTTVCDLGPQGIALATGLAYTVTSAVPDVDGTSITAAAAASIIYK